MTVLPVSGKVFVPLPGTVWNVGAAMLASAPCLESAPNPDVTTNPTRASDIAGEKKVLLRIMPSPFPPPVKDGELSLFM